MHAVRRAIKLEPHRDRRRSDPPEPGLDDHFLLEFGSGVKLEVQCLAPNPDAAHEAHLLNRHTTGAKHVAFGDPDEPEVRPVEDDAHWIAVRPPDAILHLERVRWRSVGKFGMA